MSDLAPSVSSLSSPEGGSALAPSGEASSLSVSPSLQGGPSGGCTAAPGAPPFASDEIGAQIARMRALAGLEDPPAAPGGADPALMFTPGTFDAISTPTWGDVPPFRHFHEDGAPLLGEEFSAHWPTPDPEPAACKAPLRGVKGCGCGVRVVRDHCDRLECVTCEERNRARRAADILERLELARRGRPVLYSVFTVPPERRQAAADPATWRRWLARLMRYLKKYLDLDYAAERSDPAGEDKVRWHPHVNLLWIRKSGRGYLEPAELDALKARWARIIGSKRPANIYTAFTREKGKLLHLASYLGRTWPTWAKGQKYMLRVKWYGRPPKVPPSLPVTCCDKCGKDIEYLKCGTEEEAARLAALGYERLASEAWARRKELRKRSRLPHPRRHYFMRISATGSELVRDVRPV